MEKTEIVFVKQLIQSLEKKLLLLENARKNNNSSEFNKIKKDCFEIQLQLNGLIK